ncbi:flippase [Aquihabitans sp. McL0605]|uniref:flippase n=1 Tax=Aquihabitans sp. McL0605 TaxID=3415671 RepID=UPI003CEFCC5E
MSTPATLEPGATAGDGDADGAPAPVDEVTNQIRGSSLLVFGRILSLAANLVIQVLLVRSLSKTDYGIFAYALSIVTMIATLCTLGLDRGLARFIAMYDEEGKKPKVWGTLVLQLISIIGIGLAATALVVVAHGWIGDNLVHDDRLGVLLAVMVILAPLQALDNMAATIFAAFGRSKAIFLRRYIVAPLLRLGIVLMLLATDGNLYVLGTGYVLAGVFGLVVYGKLMMQTLRQRGLLDRVDGGRIGIDMPIREVTAFTLPLLMSDAMFVVLNTSDVVILGHSAGAAAVASYRSVLPLARLNQVVMNSFSLLFAPLMARLWARGDRRALKEAYWQTAAWVTVLTFPIFAVTLGLAQPVTVALFGSRYADAAAYLRILSIAYYFNAVLGFNGVTVKMIGRVWLSAGTAGVALVFNLAINLILIPMYGPMGAACGTAASIVFYNLLKQWALREGSGLQLFDPRYLRLYLTIIAGTVGLLLLDLSGAAVVVRVVLVAAIVAIVLLVGRKVLMMGEMFPELNRIPLVGRLIGSGTVSQ